MYINLHVQPRNLPLYTSELSQETCDSGSRVISTTVDTYLSGLDEIKNRDSRVLSR